MELNVESYTGSYIRKTHNHLYIAPSQALKSVVAHYTITFSNLQYPIPANRVFNLIPDVSGCFVFKFYKYLSIKVWGPQKSLQSIMTSFDEVVDFIDQLLCREIKKHQVRCIIFDCLKCIENNHGRISPQLLTNQFHKSERHFNHIFKQICETTPTHYLKNMPDFYNELYKFSS